VGPGSGPDLVQEPGDGAAYAVACEPLPLGEGALEQVPEIAAAGGQPVVLQLGLFLIHGVLRPPAAALDRATPKDAQKQSVPDRPVPNDPGHRVVDVLMDRERLTPGHRTGPRARLLVLARDDGQLGRRLAELGLERNVHLTQAADGAADILGRQATEWG